jgi:hypothetical protein
MTCVCPAVPDLSEVSVQDLSVILRSPLKCTCCGQELELRCPEGHVHKTPPLSPRKFTQRRTYRDKVCACGMTFTPTGPRDVRCAACKSMAVKAHLNGNA